MKLKYKKIIILTTMSTMGIGLLTLSISQDKPKTELSMNTTKQEAGLLDSKDKTSDANTLAADANLAVTSAATSTPRCRERPTARWSRRSS